MDSINHIKIVTTDPASVDRFLRAVVDFPAGWPLGAPHETGGGHSISVSDRGTALLPDGGLTWDSVHDFRGADGSGGYIAGSPGTGQFQLLGGPAAHIWAVAIGTRHVERAHQRCIDRAIPCTEIRVVPWGGDGLHITVFFTEVGGIVFEVMRVEPKIDS